VSAVLEVGHFAVVYLETGDPYGVAGHYTTEQPLVEFYDTRYRFQPVTPGSEIAGQFTGARYYASTLLERPVNFGLMLDMSVPAWTVSAGDMHQVIGWLRGQVASSPMS